MKLIVGLGNPGKKYKNTRHNVGHMVIERLHCESLTGGLVAKKSNVFMNKSGDFVSKLVRQYRTNLPDLWIIHDDLDITLGEYKIQKGKGPKDHNGLLDIYEKLGTKDFWHVRVGVENRKGRGISGEKYVLQNFSEEELEVVKEVLEKTVEDLKKRLVL